MDVRLLAKEMAVATASDPRMAPAFADILPDSHTARHLLERLRRILFPGLHGYRDFEPDTLAERLEEDLTDFRRDLCHQISGAFLHWAEGDSAAQANEATDAVMHMLPAIRDQLSLDVQAAYDGDPAARHIDEVMLCYPGVRAGPSNTSAGDCTPNGSP